MIIVEERQQVGQLLHARFESTASLSFPELKDAIEGMEALFLVHAVLAGDEVQPKLHTFSAKRRMDFASGIVASIQVRRLNYNSPLELFFSATTVGGVSLYLFNRMVGSFNAVQQARVNRARANTEVERQEFEREIIEAARSNLQFEITAQGAERPNSEMQRAISSASRVLAELESVEIIAEDEIA